MSRDGRVLLGTVDACITDSASNLAYQEANKRAGRYIGEIRLQSPAGVDSPLLGACFLQSLLTHRPLAAG